jgi:hypothetical protein
VFSDAIAAQANRKQGCNDYDQTDCDDGTNLSKLCNLDLGPACEADERAEADKHAGDFSDRQE